MKKILKYLAMGLIAAPLALASCSDDPKDPNTPGPGPGPGPVGPGEKGIIENAFAPIAAAEGDYEAGDAGVSVKINSIELKNVIFEVTPGSRIKSYRMDVFPLSAIYSNLQNSSYDATSGQIIKDKYTVEETTEKLFNLVNTKMTGDQRDLLFTAEKLENFANAEFDWANSPYYYIQLVPDAQYLIVAQGYYDEEGKEPCDDLTVCHFNTATQDLVGNPVLEVDYTEGYFGLQTIHILNEDAPYFYYFAGPKEGRDGCQFFYDTFGERMFIDFIRHTTIGGPSQRDDVQDAMWQMDLPTGSSCLFAGIPLDVNEVPNLDGFVLLTLTVQEVPDNEFHALCTIEPDADHIGADAFRYNYTTNAACARFSYNVFTKEDGDKIAALEGDALESFKTWLINTSWVVVNRNYKFSGENKEILGTGDEGFQTDGDCRFDRVQSFSNIGSPIPSGSNMQLGTDYVLIACGLNPYYQYSPLHISQPFRLKSFVRDAPERCEANLTFTPELSGRDGIRFNFNFEPGKASMIYFNWYGEENQEGPQYGEETSREEWLKWLLDKRYSGEAGPNAIPWAQIWGADEPSGYATAGLSGLDLDHTYHIVYCATDYNGVVSEVKTIDFNIPAVPGGLNPQTTITWTKTDAGTYNITYTSNNDMTTLRYGVFGTQTQGSGLDMLKQGIYTYEEYIAMWEELVMGENSLKAQNLTIVQENPIKDDPCLVLAMPFGKNEGGSFVRGELQYLLFVDGEFRDLTEFAEHE